MLLEVEEEEGSGLLLRLIFLFSLGAAKLNETV